MATKKPFLSWQTSCIFAQILKITNLQVKLVKFSQLPAFQDIRQRSEIIAKTEPS